MTDPSASCRLIARRSPPLLRIIIACTIWFGAGRPDELRTYHSKSLRRSGADVVRAGAYDIDPDRLAAFCAASGHQVCDSEDEVFDGCDAVYICTWTSEHPRLVEAACARGLAIFC